MGTTTGCNDKHRQSVVSRAKESTVLDAAFQMVYYNLVLRMYGPDPRSPEILISEVFDVRGQEAEVVNAVTKAKALLGESYGLVEALYEGNGPSSEQTMSRLRKSYPGFSEECYDMVWGRALRDAR